MRRILTGTYLLRTNHFEGNHKEYFMWIPLDATHLEGDPLPDQGSLQGRGPEHAELGVQVGEDGPRPLHPHLQVHTALRHR